LNLEETIAYHEELNKKGIVAFPEKIPDVSMQTVIDEPFRGNVHLSMIFSNAIDKSEKDFLVAAFNALEYDAYDISEEFGNYSITPYNYGHMLQELAIPKTKEVLNEHQINAQNCTSILKLREKDELTFLIKTERQYIFILESFWWS
jgi:hypothetical protein